VNLKLKEHFQTDIANPKANTCIGEVVSAPAVLTPQHYHWDAAVYPIAFNRGHGGL